MGPGLSLKPLELPAYKSMAHGGISGIPEIVPRNAVVGANTTSSTR